MPFSSPVSWGLQIAGVLALFILLPRLWWNVLTAALIATFVGMAVYAFIRLRRAHPQLKELEERLRRWERG